MSLIVDLNNFWLNSGLNKGDNVLLHSNIKRTFFYFKKKFKDLKIGDYFESILNIILPNGTLVLPTFNFDFNRGITFDYFKTKSQMGSLTEFARTSKLSYRTLNPVYSFAVIGNLSKKFYDIDNKSWYSNQSPFKILNDYNFKIFILDLDDNHSMTFVHYCEEYFQVNYRFYKGFNGYYIGPDGKKSYKTYMGYVRKIDEGIVTNCNPASDILWERNLYKGQKPFVGNGLRFIYANDYFNFFKEYYELHKLENIFYEKK